MTAFCVKRRLCRHPARSKQAGCRRSKHADCGLEMFAARNLVSSESQHVKAFFERSADQVRGLPGILVRRLFSDVTLADACGKTGCSVCVRSTWA